jgi:hypothetical protein
MMNGNGYKITMKENLLVSWASLFLMEIDLFLLIHSLRVFQYLCYPSFRYPKGYTIFMEK